MLDEGCHAGLRYLGIESRTVAYAEWDAYAASQLIALMESECLDAAPVFCGDLARFPFADFRGHVHGLTAGFPCQPHSVAGKRKGLEDDRWIWPAIMQGIRDLEPGWVLLENVPGLANTGGLAECLKDLGAAGFDAEWLSVRASDVGASHQRERLFILAYRRHESGWALQHIAGASGSAPNDSDGGEGMGNARLQHGDVQQWQIWDEHTQASCELGLPTNHERERERDWIARNRIGQPANDGAFVADASSSGSQGRELGRTRIGHGGGGKHMDQLSNFVAYSPQGQAIRDGQESSETSPTSRPRLNPAFAAWLMGWPWFWTNPGVTSCAASAMALYRHKLDMHLSGLLSESESQHESHAA